ncbi:hypothetical protein BBJ28_00019891, partial [Nothophytophthora sp. Chile5]
TPPTRSSPTRSSVRVCGLWHRSFNSTRADASASAAACNTFSTETLRHINDPEHPLTLEQLKVMSLENIHVDDAHSHVKIYFTPTIPHCSMATLIGLCLRVKLLRSLPARFKVDILITPGTHSSEAAVNKQLNDKERVAAALENSHLLTVVNKCIANTDK